MTPTLVQILQFLDEALEHGYGSEQAKTTERNGFKSITYQKGEWLYNDSYTGFFRSYGSETIFFKGQPVWVSQYGGGMTEEFQEEAFAKRTFQFLKEAFRQAHDGNFQFRGPPRYVRDDWEYHMQWRGSAASFTGSEHIRYKGSVVFTHEFFGGLVQDKKRE
ncbi:hypothetical protein GF342_05160 [Candidatus Woesearchaeota archaeon]|nr:hypothetical protein [Candidatus Woesearchaeota archaeon]